MQLVKPRLKYAAGLHVDRNATGRAARINTCISLQRTIADAEALGLFNFRIWHVKD